MCLENPKTRQDRALHSVCSGQEDRTAPGLETQRTLEGGRHKLSHGEGRGSEQQGAQGERPNSVSMARLEAATGGGPAGAKSREHLQREKQLLFL